MRNLHDFCVDVGVGDLAFMFAYTVVHIITAAVPMIAAFPQLFSHVLVKKPGGAGGSVAVVAAAAAAAAAVVAAATT